MKNNKNQISLRPLQQSDLMEAMRLKNDEGWNQTEKDWIVFLNGKKNINFIAETRDKTVGTVTAINYGNEVAWLGMMIVDKAYRGMGISKKLMTTAIEQLKQINCSSIKLDATPQGRPVYIKLGFEEEYTIYRMVHPGIRQVAEVDTKKVIPVSLKDIPRIIDLDHRVFGADRSDLIRHLIANNPEKSFLIKKGGQVTGFVLGREGTRFTQVGPVVAANDRDADTLIVTALNSLRGKAVVIDLPGDKNALINRLLESGFENQRPLYRMYLEDNPYPGDPEYQYAICGPEFG